MGTPRLTIRADTATYLERSEFLGAYYNGELIGFLKIVYVDQLGCLMQIMSKIGHQDKRPTNALIVKVGGIDTATWTWVSVPPIA